MRKSTLFVSAALTVFIMVMMFGVVSAYQNISKQAGQSPTQLAAQPLFISLPEPTATEPLLPQVVSPEQATTAAIEFLGASDVYSVEVVEYESLPAYLVTFSSGDLVYVSAEGKILANTKLEPVIVMAGGQGNGGGSGQGNNGGNSGGGDDHDDDDNEEDHDDDDHGDDD